MTGQWYHACVRAWRRAHCDWHKTSIRYTLVTPLEDMSCIIHTGALTWLFIAYLARSVCCLQCAIAMQNT